MTWRELLGGLVDHVTKCGFTQVSCPNMCMIEHEESQMMGKDLNDHLSILSKIPQEFLLRSCYTLLHERLESIASHF